MKWLTTGQVAEMLGRSKRDIIRMIEDERFDYFPGAYRKPGGHYRLPAESVATFLAKRQRAAQTVHRRLARQKDDGAG